MRSYHFHDGLSGSALKIHVTPRARKNELTGIYPDGTLRIRLTAAPVDGAANKALIELIAKILGVRESTVEIIAGEKGRDKLVSVVNLKPEVMEARLEKYLQEKKA